VSSLNNILSIARKEGRTVLSEQESKIILKNESISITEPKLATSAKEAIEISEKIGFPVVLKISSNDITHKSDVGGVRVGLKSKDEINENFTGMLKQVKEQAPEAVIQGITVQPMAPPNGVEVIVGVTRDEQFGPVVMFGLGGIAVEILQDVSFRIAPLTDLDAEEMIKEIKGFRMLTGYRAYEPVDLESLKLLILKVSKLAMETEDLMEMDLNPVFAYANGVIAADARIILIDN
jgi:acyl-CoA synthetase (NDP forming)|tara:strand:- start:1355 stop:2059 length:705 start_codon:yes stop_codon:yes gene_type:complete